MARSTRRPSDLETILCFTTRMSPDWKRRGAAEGFEQFVGERVAGVDFVGERDRDQAEFIGRCELVFLSPLRGWRILQPPDPRLALRSSGSSKARELHSCAASRLIVCPRRYVVHDTIVTRRSCASFSTASRLDGSDRPVRAGIFAGQALGAGFAGERNELLQVFGIVDVDRDPRQSSARRMACLWLARRRDAV